MDNEKKKKLKNNMQVQVTEQQKIIVNYINAFLKSILRFWFGKQKKNKNHEKTREIKQN